MHLGENMAGQQPVSCNYSLVCADDRTPSGQLLIAQGTDSQIHVAGI